MELTRDGKKFGQIAGEARTALNMWNNVGTYTTISKFHKEDRMCIFCGIKATSAEHLVDKAKGGNHTLANVIPVCSKHKKKGTSWLQHYSEDEQRIILERTGYNDDARLNPHAHENDDLYQEFRDLLTKTVNDWREEKGFV